MSKSINLEDLSSKELEELLAKKQKQEAEDRKQARADYETQRDALIEENVKRAIEMSATLSNFKKEAYAFFENIRQQAMEYGDIKGNSKGGFGLRTKCGKYRAVLERRTKFEYDERAALAEQQLKNFLEDMVKKADRKAYNVIVNLLSKNKKGDYNPALINNLIQIEDNYTDDRWKKAIQLFKESYQTVDVSMSVSFYQKDANEEDQHINLSFPSLPL